MMMMMIFAKAHCPRERNTTQTTKKQTGRQAAEKPGIFLFCSRARKILVSSLLQLKLLNSEIIIAVHLNLASQVSQVLHEERRNSHS
jgi:hypothetical protein